MKRIAAILVVLLAGCGGGTDVFSIPVGTCFDDQDDGEITSVPEVDCAEPHDNEVFALIDYTGSEEYPGSDQMSDIGTSLCEEQVAAYTGFELEGSELAVFSIYPTAESWADGDREVICALYNADLSKLTGSLRDG